MLYLVSYDLKDGKHDAIDKVLQNEKEAIRLLDSLWIIKSAKTRKELGKHLLSIPNGFNKKKDSLVVSSFDIHRAFMHNIDSEKKDKVEALKRRTPKIKESRSARLIRKLEPYLKT